MTVKIVAFEREPALLDRFLAVEAALYQGDPIWSHLPRRDARPLLGAEAPFFRQGGRHRCFLAESTGGDVGRAAAMVSPRLVDDDGQPLGLIGLWECSDDPAAASGLLEAALGWLRAQGVPRALGPLDFSTWYRYRFVTGGAEHGPPFLLEPYHRAGYAAQWQAAGFVPFREYASLRIPHTPAKLLERAYTRAVGLGARFEPLEGADPGERLRLLYDMSRRIFAGKTAYAEIGWEEFQALYQGSDALLVPGLSWLAFDGQGQAVGFLFAYPDLLEPLRKRDPAARIETTVLKTIAADPDSIPGLGWALCHLHIERARAHGFQWGIYALMEKFDELLRFANHKGRMLGGETGQIWRRYTLFQRAV